MLDFEEHARKWEELCEKSEALNVFVDRVEAKEDRITYTFDGFILCTLYYEEGRWIDVGDIDPEDPCPTPHHHFKNGETLEEVFKLLEDEILNPPESVRC